MTTTFTRPELPVRPLSERDQGDDSELGCVPVLGLCVSDYDCCSTEAWILVGPSLGDEPTLLVEVVEATAGSYYDRIRWSVVESWEALTMADVSTALLELLDPGYRWGFRPCRSCRDAY